jgi:hypothetical protein
MDTNLLDTKFARMGARLKVADRPSRRTRTPGVISLDVQTDRKGEFFEIVRPPDAEVEIAVLDVQPADRHLRHRQRRRLPFFPAWSPASATRWPATPTSDGDANPTMSVLDNHPDPPHPWHASGILQCGAGL